VSHKSTKKGQLDQRTDYPINGVKHNT